MQPQTLRTIRAEWVAQLHGLKGDARLKLLRRIQSLTFHIRFQEQGSIFRFVLFPRGAQSLSARAENLRLVD